MIAHSHTNIIRVEKDGQVIYSNDQQHRAAEVDDDIQLDMRMVYDFAVEAPLEELLFVKKTMEYNMRAAEEAIKGNYGHNLGKTIDRPLGQGIFGKSIFSHIIAKTASACDARMGGALIPVTRFGKRASSTLQKWPGLRRSKSSTT